MAKTSHCRTLSQMAKYDPSPLHDHVSFRALAVYNCGYDKTPYIEACICTAYYAA